MAGDRVRSNKRTGLGREFSFSSCYDPVPTPTCRNCPIIPARVARRGALESRRTLAAFLISALLAGGNAVAIRFSNHELAPLWGASLRFIIATAVLGAAVAVLRIGLPRGNALMGAMLYGVLSFAITFGLAYWGLLQVGAGMAQIILALVPLLTLLLAVGQGLERLRWQSLLGSVISLAGIAIIFREQLSANVPLLAMLAVVGGAISIAESNVVIKRFPRAHPVATNAVAMGTAALVLLVATLLSHEAIVVPTQLQTLVAVGYISVIGSVVVFSLFLYVIARWSASASSYVMLLIPLVTVVLGAALDHEAVTMSYLTGGPLVLAGVYIGAFAPSLTDLARRLTRRRQPARSPAQAWAVRSAPAADCPPQTDDGIGNPGTC
jgi:drug/metabolite transporter (DMT)-like permease